jgi:hypothetical protein
MAQTTQQPILEMEIIDNYVCTQHLVGGGEVRVCLLKLGHPNVSWSKEFSVVVSVVNSGLLRQSVT